MKLGLLAPRFSQVSFGRGSKLPLALTMDSSIWGKRQGQWSECHLLHLLSRGGTLLARLTPPLSHQPGHGHAGRLWTPQVCAARTAGAGPVARLFPSEASKACREARSAHPCWPSGRGSPRFPSCYMRNGAFVQHRAPAVGPAQAGTVLRRRRSQPRCPQCDASHE